MREIKFRGKHIDTGNWVYGSLMVDDDNCITVIFVPAVSNDFAPAYHKVDPKTVGQYTGLKDKNGVEIYEGDIVMGHICGYEGNVDFFFEVFFHEGCFSVKADDDYFPCLFEAPPEDYLEVIGNVFENPELIR